MLVASIDTDRAAEGPPPSSACPQAVGRALSTVIAGVSTASRLSPILPRCHSFLFFAEAPPRSGASPFQQIAAVPRCLRQRVIRSILRHANPVRSRRLATVDTVESVGSNVGLAWTKASEVQNVIHHHCNFCGGSRGPKTWSFVENRAALKSGTFLVHNCRCSCLDR